MSTDDTVVAQVFVVTENRQPTKWYFGLDASGDTGIFHVGDAPVVPRIYIDVDDAGSLYLSAWRTDENGRALSVTADIGIIMTADGKVGTYER